MMVLSFQLRIKITTMQAFYLAVFEMHVSWQFQLQDWTLEKKEQTPQQYWGVGRDISKDPTTTSVVTSKEDFE